MMHAYKLGMDPHDAAPSSVIVFNRVLDSAEMKEYGACVNGPGIISTNDPINLSNIISIYNRFGVFVEKI